MIPAGLIQGLSTGFFLYITFAEMIFEEMRNEVDLLLKVYCVENFNTYGTRLLLLHY